MRITHVKRRWLPAVIMLIYGASGLLSAAAVSFLLIDFAAQAEVSLWLLVAVPVLLGMLFSLLLYSGSDRLVRNVNQSMSRAILVALLTWITFALLATWAWCVPENYSHCLSNALIVAGILGGAPLLIASLVAGFAAGKLIEQVQRNRARLD